MADRPDSLSAYKLANDRENDARLRQIADPDQQREARALVELYYQAWRHAIGKAHARRFDDSPRIYERKIRERRIDPRLIPPATKEQYRRDAIKEAVAVSRMRIEDINRILPDMIAKVIDNAVKLSRQPDLNRAPSRSTADQELAKALAARAAQKSREREKGGGGRDR